MASPRVASSAASERPKLAAIIVATMSETMTAAAPMRVGRPRKAGSGVPLGFSYPHCDSPGHRSPLRACRVGGDRLWGGPRCVAVRDVQAGRANARPVSGSHRFGCSGAPFGAGRNCRQAPAGASQAAWPAVGRFVLIGGLTALPVAVLSHYPLPRPRGVFRPGARLALSSGSGARRNLRRDWSDGMPS